MKFLKDGNEITREEAMEWLGKEKLEQRIQIAKETHQEDPWLEISWMDGFEIDCGMWN